jgi:hypothetical protein
MRLPNFRRIIKQDFQKEFQELIERLSVSINNGFDVMFEALNNKISLQNNIMCTVIDLEIEPTAAGIPKNTTQFTLTYDGRTSIVLVGKLENLTTSSSYPTSAPFVSWTQTDKILQVNHITGLTANNKYSVRIVAFGQENTS